MKLPLAMFAAPLLATACAGAPNSSDPYAGAVGDVPSVHVLSGTAEVDLVSNRTGAATQDANLTNPWGIAFNPAGPAWIANNHSGTSTVYDSTGALKLTVTFPVASGSTDVPPPTGQVFNAAAADFSGDKFIFDGEDGRVYAWQPATGVVVRADNSATAASYKGLALATNEAGVQQLYATDFHNNKIDVLDASYAPVAVAGDFRDDRIPYGYAPFGAQAIDGKIVVTYAKQDAEAGDDAPGAGNGYVDLFDTEGNLERRLVTRGDLNSPWGLALAPSTWGALAGDLLVANQGNGRIHAYNIHTPAAYGAEKTVEAGTLATTGKALAIDGLWAIAVGPDNVLYFTAGPNAEADGLFGQLTR